MYFQSSLASQIFTHVCAPNNLTVACVYLCDRSEAIETREYVSYLIAAIAFLLESFSNQKAIKVIYFSMYSNFVSKNK